MASNGNTISTRIQLDGGDQIKRSFDDLGRSGKQAFQSIKDAGQNIRLDEVTQSTARLGDAMREAGQAGQQAAQEISQGFEQAGQQIEQSAQQSEGFAQRWATVAATVTTIIGGVVAAANTAINSLVTVGAKAAEELDAAATHLGTTTSALQDMRAAIADAGADSKKFESSLASLMQTAAQTAERVEKPVQALKGATTGLKIIGFGETNEQFTRLTQGAITTKQKFGDLTFTVTEFAKSSDQARLSMRGLNNEGMGQAGALVELFGKSLKNLPQDAPGFLQKLRDAFATIEDPVKRASIAARLFPNTFREMLPVLEQTKEKTAEAVEGFDELGRKVKDPEQEAGLGFSKALADFNEALKATKSRIGDTFAPPVTSRLEWLTGIIDGKGGLRDYMLSLARAKVALFDAFDFKPVQELVSGAMRSIINTIDSIFTPENITGAIKTVIGVFKDLSAIIQNVLKPAFDAIQAGFDAVANFINDTFGTELTGRMIATSLAVLRIASSFGLIAPIVAGVGAALTAITHLFGGLGGTIAVVGTAFLLFSDEIKGGFERAFGAIREQIPNLSKALDQFLHKDYSGAFDTLKDAFIAVVKTVFNITTETFTAVNEAFTALGTGVKSFIAALDIVASALNAVFGTTLTGRGLVLATVIAAVSGALSTLGPVIISLSLLISRMQLSMLLLISSFVIISRLVPDMGATLRELGEAFKALTRLDFAEALNRAKVALSGFFENLGKEGGLTFTILAFAAARAASAILTSFRAGFLPIIGIISSFPAIVAGALALVVLSFTGHWEEVKQGAITVFKFVADVITGNLKDAGKQLEKLFDFSQLSKNFSDSWVTMLAGFVTALGLMRLAWSAFTFFLGASTISLGAGKSFGIFTVLYTAFSLLIQGIAGLARLLVQAIEAAFVFRAEIWAGLVAGARGAVALIALLFTPQGAIVVAFGAMIVGLIILWRKFGDQLVTIVTDKISELTKPIDDLLRKVGLLKEAGKDVQTATGAVVDPNSIAVPKSLTEAATTPITTWFNTMRAATLTYFGIVADLARGTTSLMGEIPKEFQKSALQVPDLTNGFEKIQEALKNIKQDASALPAATEPLAKGAAAAASALSTAATAAGDAAQNTAQAATAATQAATATDDLAKRSEQAAHATSQIGIVRGTVRDVYDIRDGMVVGKRAADDLTNALKSVSGATGATGDAAKTTEKSWTQMFDDLLGKAEEWLKGNDKAAKDAADKASKAVEEPKKKAEAEPSDAGYQSWGDKVAAIFGRVASEFGVSSAQAAESIGRINPDVSGAVNALAPLKTALDDVKTKAENAGSSLSGNENVFGQFAQKAQDAFRSIPTEAQKGFDAVKAWGQNFLKSWPDFWNKDVAKPPKDTLDTGVGDDACNGYKKVWSWSENFLKDWPGFWNDVNKVSKDAFDQLPNIAQNAFDDIRKRSEQFSNDIGGGAQKAVGAFNDAFKGQQGPVEQFFNDLTNKIKAFVDAAIKGAADAKKALDDLQQQQQAPVTPGGDAAAPQANALQNLLDIARQLPGALAAIDFSGVTARGTQAFNAIGQAASNAIGPEAATGFAAFITQLVEMAQTAAQMIAQALNFGPEAATGFAAFITSLVEMAQTAAQMIVDAFNTIPSAVQTTFQNVTTAIQNAMTDAVNSVQNAVDQMNSALSSVSASGVGGGGGGGDNSGDSTPVFARGGMVFGPGSGTSDSILARLSNGEFVIRAAAVRAFGPAFFRMLNSLKLPKFARGGLVNTASTMFSSLSLPRLGDTSSDVKSAALAPVNLHLGGGQVISGLLAPEEVVGKLSSAASSARMRSAGRKPGWY